MPEVSAELLRCHEWYTVFRAALRMFPWLVVQKRLPSSQHVLQTVTRYAAKEWRKVAQRHIWNANEQEARKRKDAFSDPD
jgi:hypothetical protein